MNSEVYYLKRTQTGERCPDCYNVATRERIKDKCPSCYGTSFATPFFTPIRLLVEYSQEERNKNVTNKGYSESNLFTIILQNVPRVSRDDYIIDFINDRIYKIIAYKQTSLMKTPSTQTVTVTELARDNILYAYPYQDTEFVDLYPRIEKKDEGT
jgi:hypothetical protein